MTELLFLGIGIVGGILSGLLGIGGGTVIIPLLVLLFGMSQHKAQGTTLASFLPPVAFLAFLKYYQAGNVDLKAAAFIAVGILLGGYLGAMISLSLPELVLKRVFGVFLLIVAGQLILSR